MMPMTTHNLLFNINRRKGIVPLAGHTITLGRVLIAGRNIWLVREHLAGLDITLGRVLSLPQ